MADVNDPRPGDLEYDLLRKILNRLASISGGGGGGGGVPAGVNGSVQFKNGNVLGGAADFLFDSGTGLLSVPSLDVAGGGVTISNGGDLNWGFGTSTLFNDGSISTPGAIINTDGSAQFASGALFFGSDGQLSVNSVTTFNADGTSVFGGDIDAGFHFIIQLANPVNASDAATKAYVDNIGLTKRTVAAGTAYTLTATNAKVTFGTTSPAFTVNKAGTYAFSGFVRVEFNGATFVAGRVVTVLLRRTNNTPGNISTSEVTFTVPVVTTASHTMAVIPLPPLIYTTANTSDIIEIWADVSVLPSAGTIEIQAAVLQAVRITQ